MALFLEILFAVIIIVAIGFVWIKTRNLHKCIEVLTLLLPTLKRMAEKTDNKIDDRIVAMLERVFKIEIIDPPVENHIEDGIEEQLIPTDSDHP